MKITILPQDLKIKASGNIQVFDYRTQNDMQKGKINLSKNTISFLRKGTKEVIGDGKSVAIDPHKFVVMRSGNCLMTEKISNTDRIYKSILLFFSDESVIDFLERNKLFVKVNKKQQAYYIFEYDEFIHNFVESLEKVILMPIAIQEQLMKAKFEEIMLYLTHQYGAAFLNKIIYQTDNTISRLRNIVENNKHNKLSLQELAFLTNMSVSTFKRAFYKQYHKTPMKWFMEERLAHIALLLRTKKKRPKELYETAGYENFQILYKLLKNNMV